jgi:hypothetical protein
MDYLCIGNIGFSQVGEPDFHMNKVEMSVFIDYQKTTLFLKQFQRCFQWLLYP